MSPLSTTLALLDWKQRIFGLYADVRAERDPRRAWQTWQDERDLLFKQHEQSPLSVERRDSFPGCRYHDYDPEFCVVGRLNETVPTSSELVASTGGSFAFSCIGQVAFTLRDEPYTLDVQWNEGYGGGLLLAFRDETSALTTYSGGRYLFDTVKGADLGSDVARSELILDFNFAYNPSCSYDTRWSCPLAPSTNTLPFAVTAGELRSSAP